MTPRPTPKQRSARGKRLSGGALFRLSLGLICASSIGWTIPAHAQEEQGLEVNSRPVSVSLRDPVTESRELTTRPVSVQILVQREETLHSRPVSVQVGTPRYGDLDFNDTVDVVDAIITLKIIVGSTQPTVIQRAVGDVDLNGGINVFDAIKILRVTVELDPPFPDFPE